ncbi:MAG: hypothetical protein ACJAZ3_001162 [Sphingobacteriales bacterium]|jgi:hypothetical protein
MIKKLQGLVTSMVLLGLFLFNGCKNPEDIGIKLQNPDDRLEGLVINDLQVLTFITRADSFRTSQLTRNLIGHFKDPVLGQTLAEVHTQFRLPSNSIDLGTNPTIDSIVLSLKQNDFYGDENSTITVNVSELTESILVDSTYFSTKSFSSGPTIGTKTFNGGLQDSITIKQVVDNVYSDVQKAPQLRIALDNAFGQSILDQNGTNTFDNSDNFLLFLKGLKITVDTSSTSGEGGFYYLDLRNSDSKLTIYYTSGNTKAQLNLSVNDLAKAHSRFSHNYTGTTINQQLNDTTGDQSLVYIQPLQGINTEIRIPDLLSIDDSSNIAINKAELIIKVDPTTNNSYSPLSKLILVEVVDGVQRNIKDVAFGADKVDGIYDEATQTYTLDFAAYLQDKLLANELPILRIIPSGGGTNGNRTVFGGSVNNSSQDIKIELKLVVTPL